MGASYLMPEGTSALRRKRPAPTGPRVATPVIRLASDGRHAAQSGPTCAWADIPRVMTVVIRQRQ